MDKQVIRKRRDLGHNEIQTQGLKLTAFDSLILETLESEEAPGRFFGSSADRGKIMITTIAIYIPLEITSTSANAYDRRLFNPMLLNLFQGIDSSTAGLLKPTMLF